MFAAPARASRARDRRGMQRARLVLAATGLLLVAGLVYAAYEAGRAQLMRENDRLRRENERLEAVDRERTQRLVEALAQLEVLQARNARLEEELASQLPDAVLRELLALLRDKLRAGIPAARLAAVIRATQRERQCTSGGGHTVRVAVPVAPDVRALSLGDGRVSVRLEGEPARDAQGRPEAWYDPSAPVRAVLVTVDGRRLEARGTLPLTQSVVVGDREYQLLVHPDDRKERARIVVETCAWP